MKALQGGEAAGTRPIDRSIVSAQRPPPDVLRGPPGHDVASSPWCGRSQNDPALRQVGTPRLLRPPAGRSRARDGYCRGGACLCAGCRHGQVDTGQRLGLGAGGRGRCPREMTDASRLAALRLATQGKTCDLRLPYARDSGRWAGHNPGEIISFRTPEGMARQRDLRFPGSWRQLQPCACLPAGSAGRAFWGSSTTCRGEGGNFRPALIGAGRLLATDALLA
jgi:hypothetical protein